MNSVNDVYQAEHYSDRRHYLKQFCGHPTVPAIIEDIPNATLTVVPSAAQFELLSGKKPERTVAQRSQNRHRCGKYPEPEPETDELQLNLLR